MSTIALRILAGAAALLLTFAAVDVPGARAQTAYPTAEGTTATTCGTGVLQFCGTETIQKCEWTFEVDLNLFTRCGGIKVGRYECKSYGYKTLYKDQREVTVPGCSTIGGGSRGTGMTGTRGSGEDDGDGFCL